MLIRRGLKGFQGPVLPRGVGSTLSCDTNPSLGPWHVSTQIWGFLEFPALGSPPTPHLSWLWASSGFLSWAHHMLPPYRSRFIYYYFFKFNSQPPKAALGRFARDRGRGRRMQRQPKPAASPLRRAPSASSSREKP